MHVGRNTAPVIDNGDGVVDVDGDADLVAVSGERLVDRVVDDFVHEVMQPRRARRPDVHGGTLPDGFEAFENLDLVGAVVFGGAAVAVRTGSDLIARRALVRILFRWCRVCHAFP